MGQDPGGTTVETGPLARGLRLVRLSWCVAAGLFLAGLLFPVLPEGGRQRITRRWSQQVLAALGVRLEVRGVAPDGSAASGWMLLPNHISWLDIVVLNAVCPVRFVSKAEVAGWPVLGLLARRAGTLFIRRERRRDTGRINADIASLLARGGRVAVFAEGTTTDGAALLPYHASLLAPAIDSGAPVYPAAIRYLTPQGTRDPAPAYTGDTNLADTLRALLRRPAIRAVVTFAAPIQPAGLSRRELARQAHAATAGLLAGPPQSKGSN